MKHPQEYRRATPQDLKRIRLKMNDLQMAFNYVETELCDHKRYYFYQDSGKVAVMQLNVKRENFMHLCGFNYRSGGAKRFWHDLKRNHLVMENLLVKVDGTTFQKLQIINLLPELSKLNLKITGAGKYLNLQYDHSIRTKRELMAIAFQFDTDGYIPLSLLNLNDTKFRNNELHVVLAIVDCFENGRLQEIT
ncbi:PBECR4 domain-containing protein [Lactiplantibacillus pentosus]|uniref:PBECR4 domain-containing protein n=2 Tax=Lactiplantibacillus pentosus TaxID=1589 RepID=A0AAW8WFK0_LACPE|nr:PBECR4 domain-containing protein [Lactiplantibacillus pentosus]